MAAPLHRVLKPGGRFAVYDIMRVGDGDLVYPVPWATSAEGSAVAGPDDYRTVLEQAGFRVVAERNRRDFALEFFARMQASMAAAAGPPPLGLHILMGGTAAEKIRNMVVNVSEGRVAPVELIAEKLD